MNISELRTFIERNRQNGSTTALCHAALCCGAYVVFSNLSSVVTWTKRFPGLKDRALTLGQVRDGALVGMSKAPVFFDNEAIYSLQSDEA